MLDLTPTDSRPRSATAKPIVSHPAALGFASVPTEQPPTDLPVEGDLPRWLHGRLVRTVPALFEVADESYRHWFDGLAKLCAFELRGADGAVRYRSRFLRSRSYCEATRRGTVPDDNFGTSPHRGPAAAARALLRGRHPTDNANVNVVRWGDRFVALTETPVPVAFDPATLQTRGTGYPDGDRFGGALTSAHPRFDRGRGEIFDYETRLGRRCSYVIWALQPERGRRRVVTELPAERPSYLHSFGETRHHLVVAEFPLEVEPLALRFTLRALRRCLRWSPDDGMRVRVIHKRDGRVVADRRVEPCFAFHHTHAWETEEGVSFCLVAYDDARVVEELTLSRLRDASPPAATGRLRRYDVPWGRAARGDRLRPSVPLADAGLELPRVAPRAAWRPARFVYGVTSDRAFFDGLVKVELPDGRVRRFHRSGTFFNEPVFVPRAPDGREDDGVLLTVALEPKRRRSLLLVLDAATLEERARAPIPEVVPFHFHGDFFAP
jgi:carotenoid cleavage dioxygenase-like enzyme